MKRVGLLSLIALLLPLASQAEDRAYAAELVGSEEVPAVLTAATGGFRAKLSPDGKALYYELAYADLEGNVTQAHIHIGQAGANGGISVWLCSNLGYGSPTPPGVQPCPAPPAHISGVITAADVVGPVSQGVAAGEFEALVAALQHGLAYANVHTSTSPSGEIRSQLDHSGHN